MKELVRAMQPHRTEVGGKPVLPVGVGLAACVSLLGCTLSSLCSLLYEAGYFIAKDGGGVCDFCRT